MTSASSGGSQTRNALSESPTEAAVVGKVAWRLLPFLTLCYLVAYLDRSNIGIAALTMMPALNLDAAQFGLAAGVFFLGYFAGELPSNLWLVRFGARRWLARIMITWGVIAVCMAFVVGLKSLIVLRVLLGIAEAGFAPGVVIYIAYWFPEAYRGRIFGIFWVAIPVATVVGAPISAALLYLDGAAGLAGWQWLFVIEGVPAVLLGVACLFVLPDGPGTARWLSPGEREVLENALEREHRVHAESHAGPIRYALRHRKTWEMIIVDVGLCAGSYGAVFFLPQIIAASDFSRLETGWLTALPFLFAAIAMVWWGWHSDRTGERRWHLALPMFVGAIGFALSAVYVAPVPRMLAFIVAATGIYMSVAIIWHFVPMHFERGAKAAAAVAIVNMTGNLAGFVQPSLMGYLKVATGRFETGLAITALVILLTACMALRMARPATA